MKKVFLKILQNSLENTCSRVSILIKLQAAVSKFIKKEILAQAVSCDLFNRNPETASVKYNSRMEINSH